MTPTTRPDGVEVGDELGVGVGDVGVGVGDDDGLEVGDEGDGEADDVGLGDQVGCGRWVPLPILYELAADAFCGGLPATTRPMADTVKMASTLALIEPECKR